MTKRVGFMFAGQGSQFVGMGKDLYEASEPARETFVQADEILQTELSKTCFNGPEDELTVSAVCQPAVYATALACLAAFQERLTVEPVVCGGLSLGEFAGLTAAGALAFPEGVTLVRRRGELMASACRETEGGMAAIIGGDPGKIEEVCGKYNIDVANYNCPGQTVISGDKAGVDQAVKELKEHVKKAVPLHVDGAFHSRLMQPAADQFRSVLENVPLHTPGCTVVQNATGGAVSEPEQIRNNLADQVCNSVHWESCVRTMLDCDVEALVEFGPGQVLTGFMRRIDKSVPTYAVGSLEQLEKVTEKLG